MKTMLIMFATVTYSTMEGARNDIEKAGGKI